jgi:hypothetical protein
MTETWPQAAFAHLIPGRDYVVVQAFRDFDRQEHPVGECWTFIGSSFLPYDDGLSLFVVIAGQREQIRMQWRDEEQGPIIDHLEHYVQQSK